MQVVGYVLGILASVAGIIAAWYLKKLFLEFYQRYQDKVNRDELTQAKKKAQADNQKANAESDKLKKVDGRS